MNSFFKTDRLAVGYNGNTLIDDICLNTQRGTILTLIGPNGAGKTTILKTVARQLKKLGGTVFLDGRDIAGWSNKQIAKQIAVMLTDRIRPELMTAAEIVAMGRYPYTNFAGQLTEEDKDAVLQAMQSTDSLHLAERQFSTLSDGERQRVMLARAICQQPQLLVLDEPTAYLDIRYKIELLDMLRTLAGEKGMAVIMSMHEIDLALKISDNIACIGAKGSAFFGTAEQILKSGTIEKLYGLKDGSCDLLTGSFELSKPKGEPQVFVVSGAGTGISCFRELQKRNIPFACGILFENDIEITTAKALCSHTVTAKPFEMMNENHFCQAAEIMQKCSAVIDTGAPKGELNKLNDRLIGLAEEKGIPIYRGGNLPECF